MKIKDILSILVSVGLSVTIVRLLNWSAPEKIIIPDVIYGSSKAGKERSTL